MARILFIAPNWRVSRNVASRRIADFHRWASEAGHLCRVVTANREARDENTHYVEDPLDLSGELRVEGPRRFGKLSRWLRDLRHLPDPGIAWVSRVTADVEVLAWAREADVILSSSPPESCHLAARELSLETGGALWVDLQDGWIDDPLRKVLEEFPIRRLAEAHQERKVFEAASQITVSSDAWRRMLLDRHPQFGERSASLPLAPPSVALPASCPLRLDGRIRLLHAGTFAISHYKRQMELLLEPLARSAERAAPELRAHVLLLGDLLGVESAGLAKWQRRFEASDWRLEWRSSLPREEYFQVLAQQHGLLLLSASMGALPSKLFEYLALGRPILAMCPKDSAVWDAAMRKPAMTACNYASSRVDETILQFLQDAASRSENYPPPDDWSEKQLCEHFLILLEGVLASRGRS